MAGTDWSSYNLPAIWRMLQAENVCTGADRVLAWDGLATSVREQHRRLVQVGEDLAAVWPPEKNASAVMFLDKIGELADSMQETLTCAESTRAGLRGVTEAIGEAQATVRELAAGRAQVSDDWIPRFIDHAEDEYDQRAQQAMSKAEASIADHGTQIQAPTLYSMGTGTSSATTPLVDGNGSSGGGSGATVVRATPVPVAVPHDPVLPDLADGSGPGAGGSSTVPAPGPSTGHDPSLGIGPGLSGVTAPLPAAAPGLGVSVGLPAGPGPGSGAVPGGFGVTPGSLGLVPGAGVGGFGAGGIRVPAGRGGTSSGRQAVPIRRGLPSGAVIGEGELGGRRGVTGQAPLGTQGNRRGRHPDEEQSSFHGEADEQWEALDGVTPVIAPDTTPVRHDPGPGVLGFGR
ncbi:hypothetical protein BJ973_004019 [Actinoplanes tereljensis]|uniref:PPE family protein n=1 Tax=Paractinoplanes tereljensis TaxID=571912 RepID=A0A919TY17_9ACTN|nr:hypothetical protein [Actinoplanes tereljensis]GIF25744.1 hypothetical protein Ate02nite_84740 [Actinoplanes tereljensis]